MLNDLIIYLAFFIVCGSLQVYFTWDHGGPARWVPLIPWLIVLALMLTGCAQQPPEPPAPAPIVNQVVCSAPVGMTEPEQEPERPQGDYTQRDVALYIESLHRWGSRGWLRLARVRDHAEHCSEQDETDAGDAWKSSTGRP